MKSFNTQVETTEEGLLNQVENFVGKISKYVIPLGLIQKKVTAVINDVPVLKYTISVSIVLKTASQSANAYKRNVREGGDIGDLPVQPVLPIPAPEAVSTGIERRFRDLIQDIVNTH